MPNIIMHFVFADIVFFGESLPERFHKHVTKVNGHIQYKQFMCCKEFSLESELSLLGSLL